jgi:type IV fimbrial biogenesis protein FimT
MLTITNIRGLTMIELMIGIVIVGLLLAFALPSYTAWLNNSQIRTAAESILNGMQLARAEAVRRNTSVQFALTSTASPMMSDWTVSVVSLLPAASAVVQTRSSAEGSATARVNITKPAGATTVTFNSLGRVIAPPITNNDNSATLTEVDVTSASASATRPLNVLVGGGVVGGGMVRMCDPAPGLAATNPQSCSY